MTCLLVSLWDAAYLGSMFLQDIIAKHMSYFKSEPFMQLNKFLLKIHMNYGLQQVTFPFRILYQHKDKQLFFYFSVRSG